MSAGIKSGSEEHSYVTEALMETAGAGLHVLQVERLPAASELATVFEAKAIGMAKRGCGDVNWLWHGTDGSAAAKIMANGFNRSMGKVMAYGEGVYFASTAKMSLTYCSPDEQGRKHIFLCSVLCGRYTQGRRGMKEPPPLAGGDGIELYDSVVDNVAQPRIVVIFNDVQAVPQYLVTVMAPNDAAASAGPAAAAGFPPVPFGFPGPKCIAAPTPALFKRADGCAAGDALLTDPACLAAAGPADAVALAARIGGDVVSQPRCLPEAVLLGPTERAALVGWLDAAFAAGGATDTDLRRTVAPAALANLVGPGAAARLFAAFGGPADLIKLRRVTELGGSVAFHTDSHARRTMQVALNSDYGGGVLVFATGAGFLAPARPAGTPTFHTDAIAHGVTALTHGVRYGLFLCATTKPRPDADGDATPDLGYLAEAAAAQLDLFDRAVPLVEAASDAELNGWVAVYHAHVVGRGPGHLDEAAVGRLGLGPELVWRVHALHPVAYLWAVSAPTDPAAWAAVDLVAAVRRQHGFMRAMAAARSGPSALAAAVAAYGRFLALARHTDEALAPTPAVDLVWHTHQQAPARYFVECVAVAGRLLDHDAGVPAAAIGLAAATTTALSSAVGADRVQLGGAVTVA